ncbi:MAG: hypothetical protein P4L26_01710 [Terracidiphilus sp.]|nr:hypothetical protein [Terracidiphilus sp.]
MSRFDPTPSRAASVNVTIDRIVLRGLDPAARAAFVEGLRSHLGRLLADPATRAALSSASASRRTPVLRLGQVSLQPGVSGARNLGAKVARAIAASGAARIAGRGVRP